MLILYPKPLIPLKTAVHTIQPFIELGKIRFCVPNVQFSLKHKASRRNGSFVVSAKEDNSGKKPKISFGDQLLDYIEGGPKLRKWYGAPEQLPRDGGNDKSKQTDETDPSEEERTAVLVVDAESDTGQLVVLSLILQRLPIKVLVKDAKAATIGFGPYVQPISGDVSDTLAIEKALKGVRAIILPSKIGNVLERAKEIGIEHVVLISEFGSENLFSGILGGGRAEAVKKEKLVKDSGVPFTIIRTGKLLDEPGGKALRFLQTDDEKIVPISREDAAEVAVRALGRTPSNGKGLLFQIGGLSDDTQTWREKFESLLEIDFS